MVSFSLSLHRSRRKLGSVVLLSFTALSAVFIYYASTTSYKDGQLYRRQLSKALANGGCEVTRASLSATPITPTWQASFPGSGARMTLFLVQGKLMNSCRTISIATISSHKTYNLHTQALTGIKTNNDYNSNQRGFDHVVTVKTHYPINFPESSEELESKFGFDRALLVVRHPKDAIPSFFNFKWGKSCVLH